LTYTFSLEQSSISRGSFLPPNPPPDLFLTLEVSLDTSSTSPFPRGGRTSLERVIGKPIYSLPLSLPIEFPKLPFLCLSRRSNCSLALRSAGLFQGESSYSRFCYRFFHRSWCFRLDPKPLSRNNALKESACPSVPCSYGLLCSLCGV